MWDPSTRTPHRQTLPAYAEAKRWRDDVRIAVRTGTIRPQSTQTVAEAARPLIGGMRDGSWLDRSGKPYKPSTCPVCRVGRADVQGLCRPAAQARLVGKHDRQQARSDPRDLPPRDQARRDLGRHHRRARIASGSRPLGADRGSDRGSRADRRAPKLGAGVLSGRTQRSGADRNVGHSDSRTTKRIYGHLSPDSSATIAAKLDAYHAANITEDSFPGGASDSGPKNDENPRFRGFRSTATGIRTPVSAVRGRRPSPLDDSGRKLRRPA